MGYWGWRPLVCGMFISTWVVGCTIVASTNSPSETPSPYPQITLTSGRIPNPTAPPATPSQSLITVTPRTSPDDRPVLVVDPPTCYEQRGGDLLCLGRVENTSELYVSAAALEVVLSGDDGDDSAIALIEQTNIPPGASAPYSVLFTAHAPHAGDLISARLIHADRDESPITGALSLDVSSVSSAINGEGGRFTITVRVINPFETPTLPARVVVMLTNGDGQVIGYRAQRLSGAALNAIIPGGSTLLHIDVFPQVALDAPTISVYVEGQAQDE